MRLDFGFRPAGLQAIGRTYNPISGAYEYDVTLTAPHAIIGSSRAQGAVSITIGDAF